MPFLLLGSLPDSLLVLVNSEDDLSVVIGYVQHFGRLVTGHTEVFDQQNELQTVLVRDSLVFALVEGRIARVGAFKRQGGV